MAGRTLVYLAGSMLLLLLGVIFVFGAFLAGGLAVAILGMPILFAVAVLLRSGPWARVVGMMTGVIYTLVIGYVATTPLRGLTPAPGQPSVQLDLGMLVLTVAFALATIFIAIGAPGLNDRPVF